MHHCLVLIVGFARRSNLLCALHMCCNPCGIDLRPILVHIDHCIPLDVQAGQVVMAHIIGHLKLEILATHLKSSSIPPA
ncbi:hypothetical protein F5890DRAFT_1542183 [Lentinula detonsa]|uniref:Secreted protein n=1 Tax=Lentinula detonsa TaxID=2804962 RepID=A0AA38PS49_9AGAR|nr:hypothetical protein F5890DRAFT_1542183 [Lentinula detonsa]